MYVEPIYLNSLDSSLIGPRLIENVGRKEWGDVNKILNGLLRYSIKPHEVHLDVII